MIYGERCHLQLESPNREITGIDGRLLHLIAINLITYAIKTSPKGNTIVFTLEGKATECTVAVRDSDTSMPAAERRRFFHVLQQPSTVETVAILGLDLAIVKEVVTFQGGSIQYDDQGEAGTAVTIIMPTLELTNEVSRSKIIGLDGQPLQPKQA